MNFVFLVTRFRAKTEAGARLMSIQFVNCEAKMDENILGRSLRKANVGEKVNLIGLPAFNMGVGVLELGNAETKRTRENTRM